MDQQTGAVDKPAQRGLDGLEQPGRLALRFVERRSVVPACMARTRLVGSNR